MENKFAEEMYQEDGSKPKKDMEDKFMSDKKKRFVKSKRHEESVGSFRCSHCSEPVPISDEMGTSHRNHCNSCLWSKHVDEATPGDRKSECGAGMEPIGITLKMEGEDKYTHKERYGDVMLIHKCAGCEKVNINRIAADDNTDAIMRIFEESQDMSPDLKGELKSQGVDLFDESRRKLVMERLFGNKDY